MNLRALLPVALVSAALGCAAAVGIVAAFDIGGGGDTTTVIEPAPLSAAVGDGDGDDQGALSARDIYRRDAPGVVFISAKVVQESASPFDFGMPREREGFSTGSGFVIDKDGTIVTNAHVVDGATEVSVKFADKRVVDAEVLGLDQSTDIAVLKVDPESLTLRPLALGTSATVQVGDPTVAIGNPFGLERTLTTGVISAVSRTIQAPNNFQIENVLQTDAAINPGNSGGPLIDATGRVIGINSQIQTGGGTGNVGIGFAVPIDTAKQIIPQLKSEGRVERAYLGLTTVTIDESLRDLNLPTDEGALVQSVVPGAPADEAGIRGGNVGAQLDGSPINLGGDIITAIDGKPIRSSEDVSAAVADKKDGDKIEVKVLRGSEQKTVEVTLGERPNEAQATP